MQKLDAHELRRSPRFSISIPYRLEIEGRGYTGETGNISMNGVFLNAINPALLGTDVEKTGQIEFLLESHSIPLSCKIVYINNSDSSMPSGVGVSFKADQNHQLADLVKGLEFVKTLEGT